MSDLVVAKVVDESVVKEVFFHIGYGNVFQGDFGAIEILNNGADSFNFCIPADFGTLTSLELIIIPETTKAAADVDLNSDYGAIGQAPTTHSETDTAITYNWTANQIFAADISSVFSSIAAGDFCGLNWDNNGTGVVNVLGVRIRYSPA